MLPLGILLAFVAAVAWAVSDMVTKLALGRASRIRVLFVSQVIGGGLVLLLGLDRASELLSVAGASLLALGLLNFLGMLSFYKGIHERGIALITPITYCWVLITVVLSIVFYGERLAGLQVLAASLIVAGILLTTVEKGKKRIDSAFLYGIVAMVVFGFYFFFLKLPNVLLGTVLVTSVVKLATGAFAAPFLKKEKPLGTRLYMHLGLIGALDAGGFLAFNQAVQVAPVSLVALISSAVPVLGVLLGVLVLKERVSGRQAVGISAAIAGMLLIAV